MILDRNLCRPFDENRNGLNMGEGAAYLVLESEEALWKSGKKAIAELKGYANINDIFHQTASSPDGAGAFASMKKALARAGLTAEDIDYINAHGTGTENNDLAEGLGIQNLFGKQPPPFSSTKPYTGHAMAASGSIEAAFCLMALQHDVIFPNLNFHMPMNELDIRPFTELRRQAGLRNILSNSFGFGGSSASLLFSKCL
jgi:3-oxoacyl-[acyl-carrier-protein] synthase-1